MIFKNFIGYMEGADISKIPGAYLTYPSKNVLVHKGTAYTRPGIMNDGYSPTKSKGKVIGEYVWKDALGGEKALRVLKNGDVELKWPSPAGETLWIKIGGVTPNSTRVRFATWIDDSGDIIRKRLFIVDGTDKIYEWNGAVVAAVSNVPAAHTIVTDSPSTLLKSGFDPGNVTPQPVRVIRFVADLPQDGDDYTTDSDMSSATIHLVEAFANSINAGDLVIGAIVEHDDILAGVDKDDIYTYKNHIGVANLKSITVYFSDAETKLDFSVPSPSDRTALSAFFVNLDQNYTAMISRFDAALKENVLWISSVDDWLKVIALDAANSNGEWIDVQQVAEAERTGALPFCVAQQKGDIIFFAQDKTLQRITTIDVLAKDTLQLLSDEVETLLPRLDADEARIYYLKRYIYVVFPAAATVVALDVVEGHFQPPWVLPVQLMSVIDGVLYGHSNSIDETFYMNKGTDDLGAQIVSVFAFSYYQGFQLRRGKTLPQDFQLKQHSNFAAGGRITPTTKVTVEQFFNSDGATATESFVVDGATAKTYFSPDDEGWATHLWAGSSIGGGDDPANPLRRILFWRAYDAVSWFEFRVIFTAEGEGQQFNLLAWFIDDALSDQVVPDDIYIER